MCRSILGTENTDVIKRHGEAFVQWIEANYVCLYEHTADGIVPF